MGATIDTHAGGGVTEPGDRPTWAGDVVLRCPSGVDVCPDGSVLVADSYANAIRRVHRDGMIVSVAGGNGAGYRGDGGAATDAQLQQPTMAVQGADGRIFVADRDNDAIRVIAPDGRISTYVGGRSGYAGDDGPARAAATSKPRALALDARGGLWFTDRDNHAVRVITPDGRIVTVAGGHRGYDGDGGPARVAKMWRPRGLSFDARGHLFIADRNNHAIREVDLDGRISTFAGGNGLGADGDGGHRLDAQFDHVSAVVFDREGVAYIADHLNHAVRRVEPSGRIDTVVGGNGPGYSGDGADARRCQIEYPSGLALDDGGNLYIADRQNMVTRVVRGLAAPRVPLPATTPAYGADPVPTA